MVSGACVGADSHAVCGHEPGDVCRVCAGQARGAEGGAWHTPESTLYLLELWVMFFVMVALNVVGMGYAVLRMARG